MRLEGRGPEVGIEASWFETHASRAPHHEGLMTKSPGYVPQNVWQTRSSGRGGSA